MDGPFPPAYALLMSDADYHMFRARAELEIAGVSPHEIAADTHMRLSVLHLGRALLLQEVQRRPVGNVVPLRPRPTHSAPVETAEQDRIAAAFVEGEGQ